MAKIIKLPTFGDERGNLTVIEKITDFDFKRAYYIYGADDSVRGGHRHHRTKQLLISINGSCEIFCENEELEKKTFKLDSPDKCLLLESEDWHTMQKFTKDCILLVLASEYYDANDYIDEKY